MIRIFSLSMGFFVSQVFLGAQNENIQGSAYGIGEKPVSEYYSSVDKKSSYQKHKIRNLKGELNNYSGRLHNLQKRFDEIFYGFPLTTSIPSHLIWKIVILEEIFPKKILVRSQCICIYHS